MKAFSCRNVTVTQGAILLFAIQSIRAEDLQIYPILFFHGGTMNPSAALPPEGRRSAAREDKNGTQILSRATGFGLEFTGNSETASSGEAEDKRLVDDSGFFRYDLSAEIRFETGRFQRSSAANPANIAGNTDRTDPTPSILSTGATFAGIRFAPYTSLLFGYVPATGTGPDSRALTVDVALRNAVFPGAHFEIELPRRHGRILLTPLSLLDSPGRASPPDAPFTGSIRESLALRFHEGFASSKAAPDRLARGGTVFFTTDGWMLGGGTRSASLNMVGPSRDSLLYFQQSELQGGYLTHFFYFLISARRSSGTLRVTGGNQMAIDGTERRLAAGFRAGPFFADLFALQSDPARRHRGDGTDPSDRLGWIDVGSSPADLPVLGGAYGVLLHPVPCAPILADRCEGIVHSDVPPGFRRAGRYGDLTIGIGSQRWKGLLRAGILVPTEDQRPSSPWEPRPPYRDYAELAAELQATFPSGSFHLSYGGEHCRSPGTGHRVLEAQVLSVFARIHFTPVEKERPVQRRTL